MLTNYIKDLQGQRIVVMTMEELEALLMKIQQPHEPSPDKEEYLSCPEVCSILNISPRTFQRYRDRHLIPFIQRGRKIYVKRSDLDTFQEANRIAAKP